MTRKARLEQWWVVVDDGAALNDWDPGGTREEESRAGEAGTSCCWRRGG